MKILVISDMLHGGGAAIAANRIADALKSTGHQIIRVVGHTNQDQETVISLPVLSDIRWRLLRRLSSTAARRRRHQLVEGQIHDLVRRHRPDVIHIHNLHYYDLGVRFLRSLPPELPILWTLHDMWSFTGRCAYNGNCALFHSGCDQRCPTPDEYPPLPPEWIHGDWETKKMVIQGQSLLHAVCPSTWLAEQAMSGYWPGDRVHVIPYPFDVEMLPLMRMDTREEFSLDPDKPVLLFGAMDVKDPRKGGPILEQLVNQWDGEPVQCLTFGSGNLNVENSRVRIVRSGMVDGPEKLRRVYSAADIYLHPALEDNFPNTIVEALSCGCPVICSKGIGSSDVIDNGANGFTLESMTVELLEQAIHRYLRQTDKETMRLKAMETANRLLHPQEIARQYERLIEKIHSDDRN